MYFRRTKNERTTTEDEALDSSQILGKIADLDLEIGLIRFKISVLSTERTSGTSNLTEHEFYEISEEYAQKIDNLESKKRKLERRSSKSRPLGAAAIDRQA